MRARGKGGVCEPAAAAEREKDGTERRCASRSARGKKGKKSGEGRYAGPSSRPRAQIRAAEGRDSDAEPGADGGLDRCPVRPRRALLWLPGTGRRGTGKNGRAAPPRSPPRPWAPGSRGARAREARAPPPCPRPGPPARGPPAPLSPPPPPPGWPAARRATPPPRPLSRGRRGPREQGQEERARDGPTGRAEEGKAAGRAGPEAKARRLRRGRGRGRGGRGERGDMSRAANFYGSVFLRACVLCCGVCERWNQRKKNGREKRQGRRPPLAPRPSARAPPPAPRRDRGEKRAGRASEEEERGESARGGGALPLSPSVSLVVCVRSDSQGKCRSRRRGHLSPLRNSSPNMVWIFFTARPKHGGKGGRQGARQRRGETKRAPKKEATTTKQNKKQKHTQRGDRASGGAARGRGRLPTIILRTHRLLAQWNRKHGPIEGIRHLPLSHVEFCVCVVIRLLFVARFSSPPVVLLPRPSVRSRRALPLSLRFAFFAGQLTWLALRTKAQLLVARFGIRVDHSGKVSSFPEKKQIERGALARRQTVAKKKTGGARSCVSRSLSRARARRPIEIRFLGVSGMIINVRIAVSSRLVGSE